MSKFNERKATQAAALFLKLAGEQLNFMVLIKFLYLVEREALSRWARPVINDEYFSMKFGPVLSHVHDLMTEMPARDEKSFWSRHISAPSNYEVHLIDDPGNDELSEAEEKLIHTIYEQYNEFKERPFDLVDHLHSILPEWEPVQEGRERIAVRSILLAAGKTAEEINQIEADLEHVNFVHSVFGVAV